jgi:hypothetical protein
MSTVLRRAGALGTTAALVATGLASAHPGERSYARTFPVASTLCAKVAAGQTPKRLKGQEAAITAACTQLQSSYTGAVNTVLAAEQTYRAGVHDARAGARETCQQAPKPKQDVCRRARRTALQTLRTLRQNRTTAIIEYRQAIESARQGFWSTIRALRGGSGIKPDSSRPDAPVPSS